MLTKKGKYGLKAMLHLAGLAQGETATVSEIAVANNIPKKFLDTILGELRNAGLAKSCKGRAGGYKLAQDPREIRVSQIIRVLDGPLAPLPCVSTMHYEPCEDCDENTCQVRRMMSKVTTAITSVLEQHNLWQMLHIVHREEAIDKIYYI